MKNDNENTNEIEISTFEALLRKQKLFSSRVHPNVVESESLQIFRGCVNVMLHIKALVWIFFWKHMTYSPVGIVDSSEWEVGPPPISLLYL